MAETDVIRTPDQRVRVFVSSALQEVAAERRAVRDAVTRLRLVPVMFELGARPHPPRPVYRAYLAQSQVFVGIYWQSYGWVAPGEQISGLEDEYRLSAGLPRLIYVKSPAPDRDPRLTQMLARIKDEGEPLLPALLRPRRAAAAGRERPGGAAERAVRDDPVRRGRRGRGAAGRGASGAGHAAAGPRAGDRRRRRAGHRGGRAAGDPDRPGRRGEEPAHGGGGPAARPGLRGRRAIRGSWPRFPRSTWWRPRSPRGWA